ncbi:MAG: CPBP family intramembrane glutamic endopeptidase [Candidatus Hermodarchaeota archaeon]
MVVQLGDNPWILIGLTFLEILFVAVPALISSRIEKKNFRILLSEMGFQKNEDILIKVIAGLSVGVLFFSFGDFVIILFRNVIIENFFGSEFIQEGQEGVVTTTPVQPTIIQLTILIMLQIVLVGPCEEAFFRGFLINKFKEKVKITYSIIISSIFFTLYHVPPFIVPLTTVITFFGYFFTLGILLALIFVYFDFSLIPCSIAHSFFNILLFLF